MSNHPHPLGSLHLFGLDNRRRDVGFSLAVVAVVLASRLLAYPVSIWEQDEAVFAGALVRFEPTDNLPHPPWFPLWIGMGKLVNLCGADPAASLQLVSLVFSIWMVFPLTALWSTVLPRRLAAGAAVLFLFAPGPWFFSGRGFCGTTATALMAAALAYWLQAEDRSRWCAAGSFFAALAVLVRPHLLPVLAGALVVIVLRVPARQRWLLLLWFVVPVAIGASGFVVAAGGAAPLWSALETHAEYHFPRLGEAEFEFGSLGLTRSLGHPFVAAVWLVLFHVGMIRLIRRKRWPSISPILLGALLPALIVVHALSDPGHGRYAVPILALMCGFVTLGIHVTARKWSGEVVAAVVVVAGAVVGPQLIAYRSQVSPPRAAIEEAILQAQLRSGVVVADRTLHAFVVLRKLTVPTAVPILFDHMIELEHAPAPPPERTVYVFDRGRGGLMSRAESQLAFSCQIPLVETLAQDRFIDIRVASGAALGGHLGPGGPLTLVD